MATVILKATDIDDIARWKAGFDQNAAQRRQHGYLSYVLYRDPLDPKTVVVISQVESLERARGLLADPSIKEVMIKAGAKGPPTMWFLDEVSPS